MTGFLGKLFGKKAKSGNKDLVNLVEDILAGIVKSGRFDLTYEVNHDSDSGLLSVEFFGEDEELLKTREGQLLDSFQLFVKRVVQHQFPDERVSVVVDVDGYREEANQALLNLAEKLKKIALSKNKSVYFRALPPKDRKIIHQFLAEDGRVKSRSIGDGHYKKIKIYPVKNNRDNGNQAVTDNNA